MSEKVRGVACDLGRTLIHYDTEVPCRALARYSVMPPVEIHDRVFVRDGLDSLCQQYEDGRLSPMAFFSKMQEILYLGDELSAKTFHRLWPNIGEAGAGMEEVLGKLRVNVRTVLISNIDPTNWKAAARLPIVRKHFRQKHCVLSFRERVRKPAYELWHTAAKRVGLSPRELIYFDDRLENVEAARIAGCRAFRLDCRDPSAAEYFERALGQYDLLVQ